MKPVRLYLTWIIGGTFIAAAVVALYLNFKTSGSFEHRVTGIYDPPRQLGTIDLAPGLKPAWVYNWGDSLYVDYFNGNNVDIFSFDGTKKGEFNNAGLKGTGSPQGMGIIGKRLLIADYLNKALVVFSPTGQYQESFANLPDKTEFIPVGVAVYNRVFYITDKKSEGWLAIGDDGVFINLVKGQDEKTRLLFPYGLVVTEDGRVIVTDPKGGQIKVFACAGWYAYDFPVTEAGLKNPQGIAIDGLDRIHVVDNGSNRVFVYDNRGRYMFKYGRSLEEPSTITVNRKRRLIYIANTEKGNIQVWGY